MSGPDFVCDIDHKGKSPGATVTARLIWVSMPYAARCIWQVYARWLASTTGERP